MTTIRLRSVASLAAAIIALFAASGFARADGEAGLVVDFGGGEVVTYCVPFTGSSISGQQLLAQAGFGVNSLGGLVCSIDGVGCTHSGTFDSCTCQCTSGGSDCTYWSFFTQKYGGSWVYSATGITFTSSKDGEMQAWRWGEGGPNSAAPPASSTFEQVCGHPPVSLQPPTATPPPPTATPVPPTATATTAPAQPPAAATNTSSPATATAVTTPLITITADASAAISATAETTAPPEGSPSPSAATTTTATATASRTGTPSSEASVTAVATHTPRAAADGSAGTTGDGGGSNLGSLLAFAAIAGLLVAGIGAAILRGRAR